MCWFVIAARAWIAEGCCATSYRIANTPHFTRPVSSGFCAATTAPLPSATIPLAVDYGKLQVNPALGWLVVSTDDPSGAAMADEVPVGTVK